MTCRFALDDGAYILGALSPAERAEFERHLALCPSCRESVAGLAVLPGLLGRLDPATAAPPVTAPPMQLPRVLAAATIRRRAEQRRRTRITIAAGAAAVVVALLAGIGVHLVESSDPTPPPPPIGYSAMQQTQLNVPIEADIALTPADGGTWVAMRCRYQDSYEGRSWPIWLVVFPHDGGQGEPIGSWMATPGKEITLTALTHYPPDQIARIELQETDQRTLLWWKPA